MAFEILSLTKFKRKDELDPDYTARLLFNQTPIVSEIYTNARLNFFDKRLLAYNGNFSKLNGDLYLKIESFCPFEIINDKEIEKEFRRIIKGNDKSKKPEI